LVSEKFFRYSGLEWHVVQFGAGGDGFAGTALPAFAGVFNSGAATDAGDFGATSAAPAKVQDSALLTQKSRMRIKNLPGIPG